MRVDPRDVAGAEEAVVGPALRRVRRRRSDPAIHGPRTSTSPLVLSSRGTSPASLRTCRSTSGGGTPCLRADPVPGVLVGIGQLGRHARHQAERRHLGHPPRVDQRHAEPIEVADQLLGRGRAADDHPQAGRSFQRSGAASSASRMPSQIVGTPARDRDALGRQQVEQARRIEVRAGEHQLGADHRGDVRQAPRVDVEHRHDRQQRVGARQVEAVGQRRGERVEQRRAVAVHHALGHPGGAARVAGRQGVGLGEPRAGRRRRRCRRNASYDSRSPQLPTTSTRSNSPPAAITLSNSGSSTSSTITKRSRAWLAM